MTPLHERESGHWRRRTDDGRGTPYDITSWLLSSPVEPAARGEGRRRSPALPRSYRTVCVRLCDGYYFPIGFSVSRRQLASNERVCQDRCGSEARLYVHPTHGGVEDMKDLSGRPYSKLETAFLYRSEYLPNCKCQPHSWEAEAAERHHVYALAAAAANGDEHAAAELLALQNVPNQPSESGKAAQTERSSNRPARMSEKSRRKFRHLSDGDEHPPNHHWLGTIFQSFN